MTREFALFTDREHQQLLRTSFLTGTVLFAVALLIEQLLLGARFELGYVLLVAAVVSMEALALGIRRHFQMSAPPQAWRAVIVTANGWLWMALSGSHTHLGDSVPYLYEFGALQIVFGYFFAGLMLRPALTVGVLIALPLPILLLLQGTLEISGIYRASAVLVAVNVIGYAGSQWIEHMQKLQFDRLQNLKAEANSDPLTGAANRRGLQRGIERALEEAVAEGASIGIATIDMDDFKKINDRYGHATGDQALCEVSRMLHSVARRGVDTVARIGGDEFAVVWASRTVDDIHQRAEALQAAAGTMTTASGVKLTASIGVLVAAQPKETTEADALLNASDRLAMLVKRVGGKGLIVREWIPTRHDGRESDSTPGFGMPASVTNLPDY